MRRSFGPDGVTPLTSRESPPVSPALWLFDFDNTLAALEPEVDWPASRRELEAYMRGQGIDEAIFREFPKGNLVLYEAVRSRMIAGTHPVPGSLRIKDFLRQASEIIENYELVGAERAVPLPGAEDLLRSLECASASIVIVTSNSSKTVTRWFERHCIAGLVRAIAGRDLLLPLKPAPDSVQRALGICSVRAADAVFIGDSEADFKASHAAGVDFYGVAADAGARAKLAALGTRHVFPSPAALAQFFGQKIGVRTAG
jgi:phosphoglycolate phosphatase-like HAD superfamily hydrolase